MNDLGSGCPCNCVYDVRYILSNFLAVMFLSSVMVGKKGNKCKQIIRQLLEP